jgi:hypothetical protein
MAYVRNFSLHFLPYEFMIKNSKIALRAAKPRLADWERVKHWGGGLRYLINLQGVTWNWKVPNESHLILLEREFVRFVGICGVAAPHNVIEAC